MQWFLCTANGSCCLRGVGIHFLLMPIITCLETHHLQVRELKSWEVNPWSHGYRSKVRANVALLRTFVFKVLAGHTVRVRF